ncbi:MAG: hypothetical protein ACO1N9_02230 [Flavobacterium sp.]
MVLQQIFERSKNNKELLSIAKYSDEDTFWCGFVVDHNDILVKLQHFTKYGKKDGIIVARLSDIERVDFNDDYTKAMQVVIDYSSELEKENRIELDLSDNDNWDFTILKQLEGNSSEVSSIEISGSTHYTGYIVEVSETDFTLHCVGKMGEDEGFAILKIEDITSFHLNDIDNRKRAMLYKWRKASINE